MTPEQRADALVNGWLGKKISFNQYRRDIAEAIREAVEAERSRCVAICDGTAGTASRMLSDAAKGPDAPPEAFVLSGVEGAAGKLATIIRGGE